MKRIKVIDDEQFFKYQTEWFKTQFNIGASSGVWRDFIGVQTSFKMDFDKDMFEDVKHVRYMLNEVGLKRLSNAVSAHKKRINQANKRSVQLTLDPSVALKLRQLALNQNMTQSEVVQQLLIGEVQIPIQLEDDYF